MTVINAMIFNANEGAMIGDTQVNQGGRRRNMVEKILPLQTKWGLDVLVGGAGNLAEVIEMHEEINHHYEKMIKEVQNDEQDDSEPHAFQNVSDFADMITKITIDKKWEKLDPLVRSKFGISVKEYRNSEDISSTMREEVKGYIENIKSEEDCFETEFLVIGKDEKGMHLFKVPYGDVKTHEFIFEPIGTGADRSEEIMGRYLEKRERTKRMNIPLLEGLEVIIRATNHSSETNAMVGGTPALYYLKADSPKIQTLGENETLLATELVKVYDGGYLSKKKFKDCFQRLIIEKEDRKSVEKAAFSQKYKEMMEYLRGYKK